MFLYSDSLNSPISLIKAEFKINSLCLDLYVLSFLSNNWIGVISLVAPLYELITLSLITAKVKSFFLFIFSINVAPSLFKAPIIDLYVISYSIPKSELQKESPSLTVLILFHL